jgi:DNA end-binding protein Ku
VQSADAAFNDIPALEVKGEMLDLARHIIKTKMGKFDVSAFDVRYESALADLVTAKLAGKTIAPLPEQRPDKVVDLLAALRESAGIGGAKSKKRAPVRAAPRRKAS